MIELLKKRFIRVSMFSSGIIIFIILALINILNYYNTINRMDTLLYNQIGISFNRMNGINYQYDMDDMDNMDDMDDMDDMDHMYGMNYQMGMNSAKNNSFQNKGNFNMQRNNIFYVELDKNGNLIDYNKDNFSYLDVDDIVELGITSINSGKSKGFNNDYRFLIIDKINSYYIIFIDGQSDLYTLKYNLIFSLIIYIIGMLGILVLVKTLTKPAVKPIVESYNKQKRFMTDIMHEVKTPLAIIETNTEVIEIDCGKNEWTNSIRNQIHYLKDLLDELVTLLKMDEHIINKIKSNINISELLEYTLTGFEPSFNKKGITLDIDSDESLEIYANEDSIEKLFSIVLENALKYTSGENKVSIKLKKQNRKILFEIENTIDSIEEGEHSEFFDRFYRSDLSRNSDLGGHGIGLSIAKEIVNQDNGEIRAFSKNNHSFAISVIFKQKN